MTTRFWSIGLVVNANTREATATGPIEHTTDLGGAATAPTSFGVDANGEVYVVSYEGRVYRLEGSPVGNPSGQPTRRRTGPAIGQAQGR